MLKLWYDGMVRRLFWNAQREVAERAFVAQLTMFRVPAKVVSLDDRRVS